MSNDTLTAKDLIERTRRHLLGMSTEPLNQLLNACASTDESLTLKYTPESIDRETYIALEDEIIYVWAVDRASNILTVARNQLGTIGYEHAAGAVLEAPGRFPRPAIRDALQDEILAWPDELFKVDFLQLDLPQRTATVDLGLDYDEDEYRFVLNVRRSPLARDGMDADRWPNVSFEVLRGMPRETFPSGSALAIREKHDDACTLALTVALPFDTGVGADNDNVCTEWGLSRSMCDIAPIGAASRMLMARDIQRSETESATEARLAEQVPPGFQVQTATAFRRMADQRIKQEANRLRGRYPVRG